MTTLSCEIITDVIQDGDQEIQVAGRPFFLFLMHVPSEEWGQARVEEFAKKLQLALDEEPDGIGGTQLVYDDSLHKEYFQGMEWDMVLSSEEMVKRAERKPGEKEGAIIKDGEGNPIKGGWRIQANIQDVPDYCAPERNEQVASNPI